MRKLFLAAALVIATASGCASITSVTFMSNGSPKIFSGARLDAAALAGDDLTLNRFATEPPAYPALDLPFSLVLDTLLLPFTCSAAFIDAAFW
jgi:uncharacterized protein YceK